MSNNIDARSMVKFNDILNNKEIILNKDKNWKKHSRMWGDKMHRICSYVAMFPPTLANYFIDNYSKEGDIVLDTFSGRGTTLLEARLLNRKSYAIDLNPFAYVLSRSKSTSFNINEVLDRLNVWEKRYNEYKKNIINIDEEMKIYYSQKNLMQLTFIKEAYGSNWKEIDDIDNFILAITLGLMHGPMRKNGTSMYFSLSMSNCISMSRNYVQKFANKNNLTYPEDNIFNKIKDRCIYILNKSKCVDNIGKVAYGNSLNIEKYFGKLKPKLVFTSPPYLNIINYTQQNWIKMWLLGYDNYKDVKLDDKHAEKEYLEFMYGYLKSVSNIMDKSSKLILVIGDVNKNNKVYSFEDMWYDFLIKKSLGINLVEIYTDNINQSNKATNSMGSKAGKATRVDKIYVFNK